jgi:hypothetical protein
MKKLLFVLIPFFALILSLVSPSHSQEKETAVAVEEDAEATTSEQNEISGKIGIFEFKVSTKMGWRVDPQVETIANVLLESDSVDLKSAFSTMLNKKGPIIYATWREFPSEFSMTASEIANSISKDVIPEEWKLIQDEFKAQIRMLRNGTQFSYWRMVGMGDGKKFGGGETKTFGAWIDIPVAYKKEDKLSGGIVSLYLRGNQGFKKSTKLASELLLTEIAESLTPINGELVPLEVLKASYSSSTRGENNELSQATPVPGSAEETRPSDSAEMPLAQATDIMNRASRPLDTSPAQMLSACRTIKKNIAWAPYPEFESANPELHRLDSICESRLEKLILFVRIGAKFGDTEKLKSYLTPLYDSASSAGSEELCNFLHYVDSIWEENDFKRPEKNKCP